MKITAVNCLNFIAWDGGWKEHSHLHRDKATTSCIPKRMYAPPRKYCRDGMLTTPSPRWTRTQVFHAAKSRDLSPTLPATTMIPSNSARRFGSAIIQADPLLLNGGTPTEASALDEITQLIDLIYSKPETAKNICWKIYRFFVYAPHTPEESLVIDGPIITEMANTLVSNNYKLQPVIENLLRSQHFYEAAAGTVTDDNFGGIIKSPLDLSIQALRFFEVPIPEMTTDAAAYYDATGEIVKSLYNQAMSFYEPYDVAGYDAYHQFPIYHRFWITPNTLANRYAYIRSIITAAEPGMFKVNVYDYVKNNIGNAIAADARLLVIELAKYLLPITDNLTYDDAADDTSGLTAKRITYFKERFLQTFDEAYWTTRWNEGAGDLRDQLEYLFNALMQSPEYQLA